MHRLKPAFLLTLLFSVSVAVAQAPAASQKAPSAKPASPAPNDSVVVNPGQGGAPSELPKPPELTHEQQEAQVKARSEMVTQMQAETFSRQMGLRPDQQQKVVAILLDRQKELRKLVSSGDAPTPEQRQRAVEIQKGTQAKIVGVLDPVQKVQYERMIAMRDSKARARRSATASRRAAMAAGSQAAPAAAAAPAETTPKTVPEAVAPAATPAAPQF